MSLIDLDRLLELDERWADATSDRGERVTLAAFRVGSGRQYALDVAHVREVVRWQSATPLPKAPRLIEGVIDLRGIVVPVVDLGRALGAPALVPGPASARIAIVDSDGLVMGLAVDAAVEVLSVDVGALEDPPALATHAGYDAARAVVRRAGARAGARALARAHPRVGLPVGPDARGGRSVNREGLMSGRGFMTRGVRLHIALSLPALSIVLGCAFALLDLPPELWKWAARGDRDLHRARLRS